MISTNHGSAINNLAMNRDLQYQAKPTPRVETTIDVGIRPGCYGSPFKSFRGGPIMFDEFCHRRYLSSQYGGPHTSIDSGDDGGVI